MGKLEIGFGESVSTFVWTSEPTNVKNDEQAQAIISKIVEETLKKEFHVPEIKEVKIGFFKYDGSSMISFRGEDIPKDKITQVTARLDQKISKYQL